MKIIKSLCCYDKHFAHHVVILLFLFLINFSCKSSKPTEPNTSNRTGTKLEVTDYILPAGETEEFPGNFEIIAEESVNIAGDLIVKSESPADFTIRCLNGDMTISGKVMVQNDTTGSRAKSDLITLQKGTVQQGSRLFFILDSPGATIVISENAQIQSGAGAHAVDEVVVLGGGRHVGSVGAPGGDIIIRARGGRIFFDNIQNSTAPVFILGNGGNGANVTVDRENFQTSDSSLEIIGGRGGDSGILILEAETIEGIPTIEQLPVDVELLAGGIGGDGGYAMWNNSNGSFFPGSGNAETTYPLEQIALRGGDGGNGPTEGGKGGFAAYWSFRIINERDDPIASASVTGGDGGDVFASPLPIGLAQGGEGGEFMVWGNNGWHGAPADSGGPIHGADGGDVTGRGGNGGNVRDDVQFRNAIGGDGGNSEVAQGRLLTQLTDLGYDALDTPDITFHLPLWVAAGIGGSGADSGCDGCPGGNSGSSGSALAIGGNGGNVPNRNGARGGRGGDIWEAESLLPDSLYGTSAFVQGGDGNPPGSGGCSKAVLTTPGAGGAGFITGEDGRFLNLDPRDGESCWPDGMLCGEGLECDADSSDNGESEECWLNAGATCEARYYLSSTVHRQSGASTTFQEWVESAELVDSSQGLWHFSGAYTNHDTSYTYSGDWRPGLGGHPPAIGATIRPFCFQDTGELYAPGLAFTRTTNDTVLGDPRTSVVTRSFMGCNPLLFDRSNPNGWQCCNDGVRWNPVWTDGEACP